jgi:hypothetical protein
VLEPETANRKLSDKHSALPEVKNWRGVSFSSAVETDRILITNQRSKKDENPMQTMLVNLKRSKKQMILPDRKSG